jgi:hypothetical protein
MSIYLQISGPCFLCFTSPDLSCLSGKSEFIDLASGKGLLTTSSDGRRQKGERGQDGAKFTFVFFTVFETQSHYVAQAGLDLLVLLPQHF